MKIAVASKNPVKIDAVRQGVALMFPNRQLEVQGFSVPSEVADQPKSDAETKQGAFNRVKNVALLQPRADLFVALEGGVEERADIHGRVHMYSVAWALVMGKTNLWGEACAAGFQLPDAVAELVRQGMELGAADDQIFGKSNSKQQNGAVGLLTHDAMTRADYYIQPVVLALIPIRNRDIYQ